MHIRAWDTELALFEKERQGKYKCTEKKKEKHWNRSKGLSTLYI